MAQKIQLRGDTAANWTAFNPVLAAREPGIETDTNKIKVGNGSSTWSALPYAYFIYDQLATESIAGIVEAATLAEIVALTDVGGTGAILFVRPSLLNSYRDLSETTASSRRVDAYL